LAEPAWAKIIKKKNQKSLEEFREDEDE